MTSDERKGRSKAPALILAGVMLCVVSGAAGCIIGSGAGKPPVGVVEEEAASEGRLAAVRSQTYLNAGVSTTVVEIIFDQPSLRVSFLSQEDDVPKITAKTGKKVRVRYTELNGRKGRFVSIEEIE